MTHIEISDTISLRGVSRVLIESPLCKVENAFHNADMVFSKNTSKGGVELVVYGRDQLFTITLCPTDEEELTAENYDTLEFFSNPEHDANHTLLISADDLSETKSLIELVN